MLDAGSNWMATPGMGWPGSSAPATRATSTTTSGEVSAHAFTSDWANLPTPQRVGGYVETSETDKSPGRADPRRRMVATGTVRTPVFGIGFEYPRLGRHDRNAAGFAFKHWARIATALYTLRARWTRRSRSSPIDMFRRLRSGAVEWRRFGERTTGRLTAPLP